MQFSSTCMIILLTTSIQHHCKNTEQWWVPLSCHGWLGYNKHKYILFLFALFSLCRNICDVINLHLSFFLACIRIQQMFLCCRIAGGLYKRWIATNVIIIQWMPRHADYDAIWLKVWKHNKQINTSFFLKKRIAFKYNWHCVTKCI